MWARNEQLQIQALAAVEVVLYSHQSQSLITKDKALNVLSIVITDLWKLS